MYDIASFSMSDMTECGMSLRKLSSSTSSMEEVANKIVHHLYESIIDERTGEPALALVRLFKTHRYDDLEPELRESADGILKGEPVPPDMRCLVLLASAGQEPDWQSRTTSAGHKAIPLPSEELIQKFPMISNLVKQFGLEPNTVLNPDPTCLRDLEERTYNVFHVPEARGSAYIPAQEDFVVPYGIRSVLGFGGILPSGDLFATIMFSKVPVGAKVADLFRPLTLSVKIALLQHDGASVFA